MRTNIDGLPEGRTYWTELCYSDRAPWVEIHRSPSGKTVKLARVAVTRSPSWTMAMSVGGFVGHCSNNDEQRWDFDRIEAGITRTIRKTTKGWRGDGTRFIEDAALNIYDFNF